MQKPIKHILAVLGRILIIGLSIQIVFGVLWIICNFGDFQEFGDSLFYIEVSKSLLFDEYTGALYPVLLMLVRGIEELLRIPYTYVMQLVQLLVAGCAGYVFFRAITEPNGQSVIKNRIFCVWGSLSLLTFPMIAQCHLAILPNSFGFSAFLLEMAFVLQAVMGKMPLSNKQMCKANVFWLLGALLLPDYLYLGMLPVLLLLVYDFGKYRKQLGSRFLYNILLFAAFAGIISGVGDLVQQEGCYNRPEKTVEAALFRRLSWSSLYASYVDWPADMQEACPVDVVIEASRYADNMELELQPLLEETVGKERAAELYKEVSGMVWAVNTNKSKIIHEIAWDVVSYSLPGVATRMLLMGRGYDSYLGRNYEIMKAEFPVLTKYYMDYSCLWFAVGIVVALAIEIVWLLCRKRNSLFPAVICAFTSGVLVVWYTLRGAGMWDYKNALFVGAMWLIWMILQVAKCRDEENADGQ